MAAAPGGPGGWCLGGLAGWEAFAVQNGPPVISPGVQAAAGGPQLQVLVVAGSEEHVLPAGVLLCPCKARKVSGGQFHETLKLILLPHEDPKVTKAKEHRKTNTHPWLPPVSALLSPLTCYIRSVIYKQISRNHCLISCQNNLLKKFWAKVLLHPGILEGKRCLVSSGRADGWGRGCLVEWKQPWPPHREDFSLNKFISASLSIIWMLLE